MDVRKLARSLALLAWLPLGLSNCGGASFDEPAVIKGLRVLAVQKSKPYPQPGDKVDLKLLFWDGKSSEDNPRDIFVTMLSGPGQLCVNPPADLYYNCFAGQNGGGPSGGDMPEAGTPDADVPDADVPDGDVPDAGAANLAPTGPGFVSLASRTAAWAPAVAPSAWVPASRPLIASASHDIDHVREASAIIPTDIIEKHGVTPGVTPRYGLAYVLFLACAGMPRPVVNPGPNTLPFGCFDADNHQLGPDDFVIGYTSLYAYDERTNNNPVVNELLFDGAPIAGSINDDSLIRHIPSCKESDREKCPKYTLQADIDRNATVERDPSATTPDGQPLWEQQWVAYYITKGSTKSNARLVTDATQGYNEKNGTEYTAPPEPGPVRLFAVVHDNRGGVAWTEGKIIVD